MLLQAAGFAVLAARLRRLLITAITSGRPTPPTACATGRAVRARGRILLMLALLVAGAVLTVDGLLGLIGRT